MPESVRSDVPTLRWFRAVGAEGANRAGIHGAKPCRQKLTYIQLAKIGYQVRVWRSEPFGKLVAYPLR